MTAFDAQGPLWPLFVGVFTILIVASIVGFVLSARNLSHSARRTVDNLNARVRAWWVMVLLFGFAFLAGRTVTLVLFALTSFWALREFITLTPTRPSDHSAISAAFYLFIPLQYVLIWFDRTGLFLVLVPVYGYLLLPVLSALKGETDNFLLRTAKIQWGLMLCVYCIGHAPALMMLAIPGFERRAIILIFYLVAVVQISDVAQYVVGKLVGRRFIRARIAPKISPNKTWEGLLGGGAIAVLVGTGLWWITPFAPWQAATLSFVIVVSGFCGGLVLSAIKRSFHTKDWGQMIQGHGGALDRMDSVAFAAPVFFHLSRYFFVP